MIPTSPRSHPWSDWQSLNVQLQRIVGMAQKRRRKNGGEIILRVCIKGPLEPKLWLFRVIAWKFCLSLYSSGRQNKWLLNGDLSLLTFFPAFSSDSIGPKSWLWRFQNNSFRIAPDVKWLFQHSLYVCDLRSDTKLSKLINKSSFFICLLTQTHFWQPALWPFLQINGQFLILVFSTLCCWATLEPVNT